MFDALELLLESAIKQHKPAAKKDPKVMKQASDIRKPHISTYQRPENWTETRVVTLIHKAVDTSETLLGNFQEFLHKDGARKLSRISEPRISESIEYVTGDWWLNIEQEKARSPEGSHWTAEYSLIIGVTFKELILHSPEVRVTVTTQFGHVSKVELDEETRFFDSTHSHFLMLHRGTDILGCMDLNSKLDLRSQVESLQEIPDEQPAVDGNTQPETPVLDVPDHRSSEDGPACAE